MLYGFKARFAEPILDGRKGGTIRVTRKQRGAVTQRPGGHAWAGERLRLYTGLRTRQCRFVGEKLCIGTASISLHFEPKARVEIRLDDVRRLSYTKPAELDAFAAFDGFRDFAEMAAYWTELHGPLPIFDGWHIRWLALPGEIEAYGEPDIIPMYRRRRNV